MLSGRAIGILVLATLVLVVVTLLRIRAGSQNVTALEGLAARLDARYVAFPLAVAPIEDAGTALATLRAPTRLRDVFELNFERARLYAFEHIVEGVTGDPGHVRLGTHRLGLLFVLDQPVPFDWILEPRSLVSEVGRALLGKQRQAVTGDDAFDGRWEALSSDPEEFSTFFVPAARSAIAPFDTFTVEAKGAYILMLSAPGEGMTVGVEKRIQEAKAVVAALPLPGLSLAPAAKARPTEVRADVGIDHEALREDARRSLRESMETDSAETDPP